MTAPPAGRREAVLRLLREAGRPMGIAEIAQRLGIHANTARFHLETLVSNGQIERATADRTAPGRPPQLYQPVSGMDPTGPRHYRVLAEVLVASLATEPEPDRRVVEAGRAWGRQQAATAESTDSVGLLMGMLDELGFAPERPTDTDLPYLDLRHCPFLELAVSRSTLVCQVHLGLMQGAMQAWDSPVTVERLDAFVAPNLCRAHLTAARIVMAGSPASGAVDLLPQNVGVAGVPGGLLDQVGEDHP